MLLSRLLCETHSPWIMDHAEAVPPLRRSRCLACVPADLVELVVNLDHPASPRCPCIAWYKSQP